MGDMGIEVVVPYIPRRRRRIMWSSSSLRTQQYLRIDRKRERAVRRKERTNRRRRG